MECKKYSELISAYVDGMLSPQEEEKLMAHLMVCETCSKEMSVLKQMKVLMAQIEEPELPDGFHEELMTRIKQEKKRSVIHSFKWKWQYSGALVATLMVGVLGLSQINKLSMLNKSSTSPIALSEAAPDRGEESATNEVASKEQATGVQVASEDKATVGRSTLMSEAANETLQETRWKLGINEYSEFFQRLKTYLEEIQVTYEVDGKEIFCHQVTNSEALMEWIQEQGIKCEGETSQATIELVIELEV